MFFLASKPLKISKQTRITTIKRNGVKSAKKAMTEKGPKCKTPARHADESDIRICPVGHVDAAEKIMQEEKRTEKNTCGLVVDAFFLDGVLAGWAYLHARIKMRAPAMYEQRATTTTGTKAPKPF